MLIRDRKIAKIKLVVFGYKLAMSYLKFIKIMLA